MSLRTAPRAAFRLAALLALAQGCGGSFSAENPDVPPDVGVFLIAAQAPVVANREGHTATRITRGSHAGEILIAGGAIPGTPVAQAELYVPGPQSFTVNGAGVLATARSRHTATRLGDDSEEVLIAGGLGAAGPLLSAEIWSGVTGAFTPAPGNLATARLNHTATRQDDGTVLVVGGDAGGPPLGSIERFVPGVGFQPAGNLVTARTLHNAIRAQSGDTVILGGFIASAGGATPTHSVEILDRATGQARTAREGLNVPRANAALVLLADGRILVAGGAGVNGQGIDQVEIYDPVRERSNGGPRMTRPRLDPRAAPLFDGRVLIVGDDNTGDLFDPRTSNVFAAQGTLANARPQGHSVTPLGTADVLIFGGTGARIADLFDPR